MALPAGAGLQGCTHIRAALVHGSGVKQGSFNHDEQDLIEEALKFRHTAEKLKKGERQQVVQAPLAHGEEVLLQRCRERLDRCGYIWPSVEVCYCDLSVIRAATPVEDSLPSLTAPLTRLLKKSKTRSTVKALNSATGVLKPGSMTLVLGPPGSGRSTLMRVLTGRLRSSKMVDIHNSNSIRFNGRTSEQFVMQRTAAYVDQNDYLFPSLTCRETLNFSETCAGVSRNLQRALQQMTVWEKAHPNLATRVDLDDEVDAMLLHMTQSHNLLQTEYALSLLGLQHVGDTLVGDAVLRGVSGGEKRRVAVGEMIVTPANFVVMDEPSTGLDSASTLALAQSMRRWAKLLNSTVMMALLQPEPEVVAQFDDILLLAEGQVVWHGPVKDVLPHFASCGLCPLLGQDLAEFLQQVATVRDQAALLRQQAGHDSAATSGGAVLTPAALSKAFWESQRGLELRAAAEAQLTPDPVQLLSLDTRRTGAPWPVLLAACTRRLFLTDFRRNWEACAIRWSLAFFMAIVTGTLFYQLPQTFSGGVNLLGLLFNALFWMQVLSVPTIEVTFSRRPLLFRQRDELFYPAWVDWLPATLLNVPVLIVDTLVYGIPVYLMADFTRTAAPLFTFLLVLFCFSLLCDNLYRVYGSASKVLSFAIGIGVCQGLINEVLAGFVITPGSIPVYWYWFYYLNPLSYAFRALAINELKQPRWAVPASAQGTAATQTTLGSAILAFFEIDSSFSWVWMGVGVLLAMSVFCAGVALLACKYNRLKESPAVLAHQHDKEQQWQGDKGATATGKKQQPVIEEKVASQDCVAIEMAAGDGHHQDSDSVSAGPAPQLRGISVAFKNLSYCVPSPSGSKGDELQLLHNITGSFRPGKLTALMGSSGAGKTTLMDVVAGRKTAGRTAGDVYVAGHPMRATNFARLSGYVEQTDIHTPLATVSEALAFSAALRSPAASRPQVSAAVSYVLDLVDLTAVSGRLVGTKGVDGLSSEQRKRLTIAVELVTFPSVLFLDEPTSGLDTRSATLIAAVMHNISRQRVTVVATIHQPSQAIFRQFDELLLLKRGGWVVYFGPLGDEGSKLVEYFSTIPQAPELQQGRNLAAWMLEVVGGPQALLPDYPDLAAHYQTSSLAKVALSQVDELLNPKSSAPLAELNPPAQTSSLQQLRLLVHRNQLSYWRNPATNLSRFLVTLAMALIVGSIEWGKGDTSKIRDARGVQNCLGALYMVASALAIEVGFECQQGLSRERVVYYREIAAASYGAGPYLAAQVLVECSYVSVQVVLYTIITYFMVGFELAAAKFFYVMVLVWLCSMVAFCTSQALVQTTPILFIATTLYSLLTNLQSLVSGYTRPLPASSRAWWGAYFLSPSYYTFIGMGSRILGDVTNPILDPTSSTGGTVTVQQYVAAVYGMGSSMYPGPYGSLGILVTISSVMLVVSYLGLRFARFQNR